MASTPLPTPEILKQRYTYDPDTGAIHSLIFRGKQVFNCTDKDGYKCGGWGGHKMAAHRVAWAIYFGEWPRMKIDHINGVRTDNRLCNLRLVSDRDNARNRAVRRDSVSGRIGVCWSKTHKRWKAHINIDAKPVHLGMFADLSDAIAARQKAEENAGYHENHGRRA